MDKESAGEIQTKSDCTKSTNNLTQGLKGVKNDKSNKGRAALGAAKSLSFGQNVKKSRSQTILSRLLTLDRRSIK